MHIKNLKIYCLFGEIKKLTLYGKVTIIQTLALSQILYVCNMQIPPPSFITDIQREMSLLKFLWSTKNSV